MPRGLTGRTVLVLLAAVSIVHFGSMWIYERGLDHVVAPSRDTDLRERLEAAKNLLVKQPLADRPAIAALLSSENFQLSWSRGLDPVEQQIPLGYDLHSRLLGSTGVVILSDMTMLRYRMLSITHNGHASHATWLSATVMVLGVVLVAALSMRGVVAPLRRLARAADAIGHTTDIATIPEQGPNEVRLVARAVNAMQQRIARLIGDRTQALAAVSHDLRTPITRLRLRAGFIADREVQSSIDRDLDEMEAMVEATLAYLSGTPEAEAPRPTDLPALLATLVDAATDLGHAASYDGPAHLTVVVRPFSLKRAFGNLITNAVDYGGSARVRLRLINSCIIVTIDDDGPGIPAADMQRIFDPFVRLEQSRNRRTGGVGLGLTIARQSVTIEGGALALQNRPGGGVTARVELPVSGPAPIVADR